MRLLLVLALALAASPAFGQFMFGFKGGGAPAVYPFGTDGDLTIISGQTVTLTAEQAKDYNSLTINSGGTLQITGNGWGYIGVKGNLVNNGTIKAVTNTGYNQTFSGTAPDGASVSYTLPATAGGSGGVGQNILTCPPGNAVLAYGGLAGAVSLGNGSGGGGGAMANLNYQQALSGRPEDNASGINGGYDPLSAPWVAAGGNGGARYAYSGSGIYIKVGGTISGGGSFSVAGSNGSPGANGGVGQDDCSDGDSFAGRGGGGGGGAGGTGGKIVVRYKVSNAFAGSWVVSAGTGGAPGTGGTATAACLGCGGYLYNSAAAGSVGANGSAGTTDIATY